MCTHAALVPIYSISKRNARSDFQSYTFAIIFVGKSRTTIYLSIHIAVGICDSYYAHSSSKLREISGYQFDKQNIRH